MTKNPSPKPRRSRRVYLNVVSATIRGNRKKLKLDPAAPLDFPITARTTRHGSPEYANTVEILDATGKPVASLVYRPTSPLGCGAVIYVVCEHGVRLDRSTPLTTKPKVRKTCITSS